MGVGGAGRTPAAGSPACGGVCHGSTILSPALLCSGVLSGLRLELGFCNTDGHGYFVGRQFLGGISRSCRSH